VELKYANGVKSGFKIGPREGGYLISFTDADLRALVESYLRPGAAAILFDEK
jgi:V/A-type H+-transporting ATPase subunit E